MLNRLKFSKVQGSMSETEMSKELGISRTHLWRAKKGDPVGGEFIEGFKKAFPDKKIEDYFNFKQDTKPGA